MLGYERCREETSRDSSMDESYLEGAKSNRESIVGVSRVSASQQVFQHAIQTCNNTRYSSDNS